MYLLQKHISNYTSKNLGMKLSRYLDKVSLIENKSIRYLNFKVENILQKLLGYSILLFF